MPEPEPPAAASVISIGWLLDTDRAQFIWEGPRAVRSSAPEGSLARSPEVSDHLSRIFEVPCPISVRLRFARDDKGGPVLTSVDSDRSPIRTRHLNQMVSLVSRSEWRHPDRPVLQFITPYVFIVDDPVMMTQIPPLESRPRTPWPGILIGGRMPAHLWPRQMMWAFEWWDTSQDLVLHRGDPWFALRFEAERPDATFGMVEAVMTPELRAHIQGLTAVSNYVDQTFSLFKVAEARRPARLLTPLKR